MTKFLYVGLDGEMSSNDVSTGGRLIQFGVTVRTEAGLVSTSMLMNPGEMQWQEEAAAVHNITQEDIRDFGKPNEIADDYFFQWLIYQGANPDKRMFTIPIGFNIMAFDMPFVKAQLPKTYSLFSRRGGDLNAMCFMLDGKDGITYDTWKKRAKKYAEDQLGNNAAHDAGWDSQMHLLCFEYLKSVV